MSTNDILAQATHSDRENTRPMHTPIEPMYMRASKVWFLQTEYSGAERAPGRKTGAYLRSILPSVTFTTRVGAEEPESHLKRFNSRPKNACPNSLVRAGTEMILQVCNSLAPLQYPTHPSLPEEELHADIQHQHQTVDCQYNEHIHGSRRLQQQRQGYQRSRQDRAARHTKRRIARSKELQQQHRVPRASSIGKAQP